MGIRLDAEAVDLQGLPVVAWEEDRNHFGPNGFKRVRVACFIRPDETGVLQFVRAGWARHGAFEEARPWEALLSFGVTAAEQLYRSATDRVLLDVLAGKSKSGAGRVLATDGAQVMLANFADRHASLPMHLNCAEASPVEMALLHDGLQRSFITRRAELVHECCDGEYVWPKSKLFAPHESPAPTPVPGWLDWLINFSILTVLGLVGWWLYWMFVR
jgi:hypothetical protein